MVAAIPSGEIAAAVSGRIHFAGASLRLGSAGYLAVELDSESHS